MQTTSLQTCEIILCTSEGDNSQSSIVHQLSWPNLTFTLTLKDALRTLGSLPTAMTLLHMVFDQPEPNLHPLRTLTRIGVCQHLIHTYIYHCHGNGHLRAIHTGFIHTPHCSMTFSRKVRGYRISAYPPVWVKSDTQKGHPNLYEVNIS